METNPIKVLVLCTGNSCRSVMAEALINELGHGRYRAWSAGSHLAGYVHPKSIETLTRHGIDPGQPRSKSWDEFANQSFDLVITVWGKLSSVSRKLEEAALEYAGPCESQGIGRRNGGRV